MRYSIKAINAKNYTLELNDVLLGKLKYDNTLSCSKATVESSDSSVFRIENVSHWNSEYVVKQDKEMLLKTKLNWNSELVMNTFTESHKQYLLKARGFWGDTHALFDQDQKQVLTVQSKYNWNKWNYDYTITVDEIFQSIPNKEVFLFSVFQGLKTKAMYVVLFIIFITFFITIH